jgi:hypothetical protein
LLFYGFQLVDHDRFAVVQQPPDEGAFPIVNAAGRYES